MRLPVAGFYILLYGIELFFVKGLHQEYNDEIDTDAMDAIKEGEA